MSLKTFIHSLIHSFNDIDNACSSAVKIVSYTDSFSISLKFIAAIVHYSFSSYNPVSLYRLMDGALWNKWNVYTSHRLNYRLTPSSWWLTYMYEVIFMRINVWVSLSMTITFSVFFFFLLCVGENENEKEEGKVLEISFKSSNVSFFALCELCMGKMIRIVLNLKKR